MQVLENSMALHVRNAKNSLGPVLNFYFYCLDSKAIQKAKEILKLVIVFLCHIKVGFSLNWYHLSLKQMKY